VSSSGPKNKKLRMERKTGVSMIPQIEINVIEGDPLVSSTRYKKFPFICGKLGILYYIR
jgi:hypothetical protein